MNLRLIASYPCTLWYSHDTSRKYLFYLSDSEEDEAQLREAAVSSDFIVMNAAPLQSSGEFALRQKCEALELNNLYVQSNVFCFVHLPFLCSSLLSILCLYMDHYLEMVQLKTSQLRF